VAIRHVTFCFRRGKNLSVQLGYRIDSKKEPGPSQADRFVLHDGRRVALKFRVQAIKAQLKKIFC
jgi:hypothetical protein